MVYSNATKNALDFFHIENNHLILGGRSIQDWVNINGSPCYIYDTSVIRKKASFLKSKITSDLCIYYSVKANPHLQILEQMARLVDGFDVASEKELKSALTYCSSNDCISFTGPGKSSSEINLAINSEIGSINIESPSELNILIKEAQKLGASPKISIRINPDFELYRAGVKTSGGSKKFGIDSELLPSILNEMPSLPVDFQGFHIYTGSQCLNAKTIIESFKKSLDLMWTLGKNISNKIRFLNLGGGFGIPYYDNDKTLDIEYLGREFNELLTLYKPKFPNAKFIIELGRYLTGECGVYVTKVLYKKISRGKTYIITDGGMNHHLAASGNFGQVLRRNYPMIVGNRIYSEKTEKVTISGPLCTPLDELALNINLPIINEGDLIVILNSGAYGYTASPIHLLSHEPPKEIVI